MRWGGQLALLAVLGCQLGLLTGCDRPPETTRAEPVAPGALEEVLMGARRIPNRSDWFEILRLPNDVYAVWEPGHSEKVNSFLILGETRDLLYDTGMGIANIRDAVADIRAAESLPIRPLMVVLSHNHLDHNGGASEFEEVWTADDAWGLHRLSEGLPGGQDAGFVPYWSALDTESGIRPPTGFDPATHAIPPFPRSAIRLLREGDRIELGNRGFEVIRTYSHSPDGIALYDRKHRLFFGGDTFPGGNYLVTDIGRLAVDLRRVENLPVSWHYASHGPQLVEAMHQGAHLAIVRRLIAGEGVEGTTTFAGVELPVLELDGVTVTLGGTLLVY